MRTSAPRGSRYMRARSRSLRSWSRSRRRRPSCAMILPPTTRRSPTAPSRKGASASVWRCFRRVLKSDARSQPTSPVKWNISAHAVGLVEVGEARASLPDASADDLAAGSASQADAIVILRAQHEADLENADIQQVLGMAYSKHADTLIKQSRIDDALVDYQADLALMRTLSDANPQNIALQFDTAVASGRIAIIVAARGQNAPALDLFRVSP